MSANKKRTTQPVVYVSRRRAGAIVDPRTIKRRAERLLVAAKRRDAELSVVLCDDAFIRELNRTYRGIDRATDVLSFAMKEGEGANVAPRMLGDVVISTATAARQSEELRCTPLARVTTLLIHGILHLFGHNHETADEREKMERDASALAAALPSPWPPDFPRKYTKACE